MHDTDEHYSDERQSHDTRMEYVQKNGRLNKLEAVHARNHMQDATNIKVAT